MEIVEAEVWKFSEPCFAYFKMGKRTGVILTPFQAIPTLDTSIRYWEHLFLFNKLCEEVVNNSRWYKDEFVD